MTEDDWDFFNRSVGKLEKEVITLKKENTQLKSEYEKECKRADELEDSYWKEVEKNKKLKELLKECCDEIEYLRKHYKGRIDHLKNNTRLDKEISQVLRS